MCKLIDNKLFVSSVLAIILLIINNNVKASPYDKIKKYKNIETDNPEMLEYLRYYKGTPKHLSCVSAMYDSILYPLYGSILWFDTNIKRIENDCIKYKINIVNYFENGYINVETQINGTDTTEDYCTKTSCLNSQCNNIWESGIQFTVISNNQISINSSNPVFVEIYLAFHIGDTYLDRILVDSKKINYIYNCNLEDNIIYIFVFRNSENDVIDVKKICRIQ